MSLKGQTNLWSDTNEDMTVKFWTHKMPEGDYKRVIWNQIVEGYMDDTGWKDRNTDDTNTTFADGIATVTFVSTQGSYHTMVTLDNPTVSLDHIYYGAYDVYSNTSVQCGIEFAGGRQIVETVYIPANTWIHKSFIKSGARNGGGSMYIPFIARSTMVEGIVTQIRNPIYVDLTLMFGAGNEPTTPEEFENLCAKNGIDISKPQSKNNATKLWWLVN